MVYAKHLQKCCKTFAKHFFVIIVSLHAVFDPAKMFCNIFASSIIFDVTTVSVMISGSVKINE